MPRRFTASFVFFALLLLAAFLRPHATTAQSPVPPATWRNVEIEVAARIRTSRVVTVDGVKTEKQEWWERTISLVRAADGRMRSVVIAESGPVNYRTGVGYASVYTGTELWTYYPLSKHAVVTRAAAGEKIRATSLFDPSLNERLQSLVREGKAAVAGSDTVLGRRARIIRTSSWRATGKVEQTYWLDEETGLLLRLQEYAGNELFQDVAVTRVEFNPEISPDVFRLTVPPETRIEYLNTDAPQN